MVLSKRLKQDFPHVRVPIFPWIFLLKEQLLVHVSRFVLVQVCLVL